MSVNKKLDCRGMVCPMPVAKTKKLLNSIDEGEIIEVTGEFLEAGENIKRFVEKKGHEILDFNIEGENYSIKIKKHQ